MWKFALLGIVAIGAALAMAGGVEAREEEVAVDDPPPDVDTKGKSGSGAGKETWKQRQIALAYLGGLGICSCDPGSIDGVFGSQTTAAIRAFQKWAGIGQTGKWDTTTEKAMSKALADAARGAIKIPVKKETKEGLRQCPSNSWMRSHLPNNVKGWRVECKNKNVIQSHHFDTRGITIEVELGHFQGIYGYFEDVVEMMDRIARDFPSVPFSLTIRGVVDRELMPMASLQHFDAYGDAPTSVRVVIFETERDWLFDDVLEAFEKRVRLTLPAWMPWLSGMGK